MAHRGTLRLPAGEEAVLDTLAIRVEGDRQFRSPKETGCELFIRKGTGAMAFSSRVVVRSAMPMPVPLP